MSSAVDRWMFEGYAVPDRSLAMSRVLIGLYLLAAGFPRYTWVASVPESFYTPPPGLAAFFSHQPPAWFMTGITAASVVSTVAFVIGWRMRAAGLAAGGFMLVGHSFSYAFGKIDHDILLITTVVILSLTGANRQFALDAWLRMPRGPSARWPLSLHALTVGLAMLSAALPKIASGWLDPATPSAKGQLVANFWGQDRYTLGGELMLAYFPDALWEFVDWSTVAIECALLPALVSLKAIRIVCAVAVVFHAGIYFTMGIFFAANLIAYAVFVDWDRLREYVWRSPLRDALNRAVMVPGDWTLPVAGLRLVLAMTAAGILTLGVGPFFGYAAGLRNAVTMLGVASFGVGYLAVISADAFRRARS